MRIGRNKPDSTPLSGHVAQTRQPISAGTLANHEIVTLALYFIGGAVKPVDTEDVAVKAHSLDRGRFAWRKYPDQISLDAVRKRLWDASSQDKGFVYVAGSERKGWMLTPRGLAFAERNASRLDGAAPSPVRLSAEEKKWAVRERSRLNATAAAVKYRNGSAAEITLRDALQFFRLDEYITGSARRQKIDRVLNLLSDDPGLRPVCQIALILVEGDATNG